MKVYLGNIYLCERLTIKSYTMYTKLVTAHLKIQFSLYFLCSLHLQVEGFKKYMGSWLFHLKVLISYNYISHTAYVCDNTEQIFLKG